MGHFFLILGGALVVLALLQCVSFLFLISSWGEKWNRRKNVLLLLLLPAFLTLRPLDWLQGRISPRLRSIPSWYLVGGLGAIFLLISLLLSMLEASAPH